MMKRLPGTSLAVSWTMLLVVATAPATAQSLEERLDEEAFLRGLIETELPEILEHYIVTHPSRDPVRVAQYEIAAEHLRMRRAHGDLKERQAALDRLLHLRDELIERETTHPHRGIWLADQAEDYFFEMLPIEGSAMTTLLGVPSASQRLRTREVARAMMDLTARAEIEIQQAILDVESRPGFRRDEALRMERRRLARDERDLRIPFLRGIALVLEGAVNVGSPTEAQRVFEQAVRTLIPLASELTGRLGALTRLYAGYALVRLDRLDEADALLKRVLEDPGSEPTDVVAARLALVSIEVVRDGPDAGVHRLEQMEAEYSGAEQFFYRLLVADRCFLIKRDQARRLSGAAQRRGLREAFAVYFDLLDESTGLSPDVVRHIVFQKLAGAAEDDVPLAELPAIVTIARAERLAGEAGRRDEAIEIFDAVLVRDDLAADERAAALFGRGRVLLEEDRRPEAARSFLRLARDHPDDRESDRAAELAASIATALERAPGSSPDAHRLAREAVEVVVERGERMPGIDRWRYDAGRMALQDAEFDRAVAFFRQIRRDSPTWADGQFMQLNALRAAARRARDPRERTRLNREVVSVAPSAIEAVRALARDEPDAARQADLRYYAAHLRVFLAETLLESDRAEDAIEAIAGIEQTPDLDRDALAGALRVRIGAFQALGRPDEARREIEQLLATAPAEAGGVLEAMLASMIPAVERLLDDDRAEEATRRAAADLAPLAVLLEEWVRSADIDESQRTSMLLRVADVYLRAGRFTEALRLYERLDREHPDTIELLVGRAECLVGLGGDREAEAMQIFRRIAAVAPVDTEPYWLAQLRMLEILDRVQQNTDRIAPRIKRLRLEDPELGGVRYRGQFQRLANKYS